MSEKCAVCQLSLAKYRCPGCEVRTCSLACVKRHKSDQTCDGKRSTTEFVAVRDFTDMNLLSDYRFLEDAGRKADSAVRGETGYRQHHDSWRQRLTQECKKRDISLLSMPKTMTRRKQNKTHYRHKAEKIFWTVHWVFPQAEEAKYTALVAEDSSLLSALQTYLHPTEGDAVIRHQLRVYAGPGMDGVELVMRVDGRPADDARYHKLDKDLTLAENLRGKSLIEHPVIECVLCYCADAYPILQEGEDSSLEALKSLVLPPSNNQSEAGKQPKRSHNRRQHWWQRKQRAGGNQAGEGTASAEGGN